MNRFFFIVIAATLLCTSAFAADRGEKIRQLMDAQGLTKTFEQQLQSGREQGKHQANDMLAQMMNGLNPGEKYQKKFQIAVKKFIDDLQPPWNATEIVETWAQFYGPNFSDEELDKLIAFYTSPLAQKEVLASRGALVSFGASFQAKYKPIMERATAQYVQNLQTIVRECNCSK